MPTSDILRLIHHLLEAKQPGRITQQQMAERLEISKRTYTEYLRGTNKPMGMLVMLDLLSELDKDEIERVLKHWRALKKRSV
jgi:transcriptional regulator with XRE-family HTH domain